MGRRRRIKHCLWLCRKAEDRGTDLPGPRQIFLSPGHQYFPKTWKPKSSDLSIVKCVSVCALNI